MILTPQQKNKLTGIFFVPAIGEGGLATSQFREMVFGDLSQEKQQQIVHNLLAYCKLDTWAMVRIWEELKMCI